LWWDNYSFDEDTDPSNAVYYLNDHRMGAGKQGFDDVLQELAQAPLGSSLRIVSVVGVRVGWDDNPDPRETFDRQTPYYWMGMSEKLWKIVDEKFDETQISRN
jgi:hypothetical protein